MGKKHTRLVVKRIEKRNLMSTFDPLLAMPPAYVEPASASAPAPAPIVQPVEPAPIQVAVNPDVTRLPDPIQTDSNPVLTMFQISSGQAKIVDPTTLTPQPVSTVVPPPATLPPLPAPLSTTLPSLPRAPYFP